MSANRALAGVLEARRALLKDVLVTKDGHEVLTDGVPRDPEQIEARVGA